MPDVAAFPNRHRAASGHCVWPCFRAACRFPGIDTRVARTCGDRHSDQTPIAAACAGPSTRKAHREAALRWKSRRCETLLCGHSAGSWLPPDTTDGHWRSLGARGCQCGAVVPPGGRGSRSHRHSPHDLAESVIGISRRLAWFAVQGNVAGIPFAWAIQCSSDPRRAGLRR